MGEASGEGLIAVEDMGGGVPQVFFKFGESVIAYADEALKAADGGALAGKYASDFLVDGFGGVGEAVVAEEHGGDVLAGGGCSDSV